MDRDAARRVLGVDEGDGPEQVRAAYLALVRAHHPDRTDGDPAATRRTAEVTRAYAVLRDDPAPTIRIGEPGGHEDRPPARRPRSRTPPDPPTAAAPTTDPHSTRRALVHLAEAGERLGHVAYLDADLGILEVVLEPPGGPTCSLLVTLEHRDGQTFARCTLESLDGRPGPPIRTVVAALSDHLAVVEQPRDEAS